MDEIRTRGIETVEIETFQERELLQRHRALAPGTGLAHRVAAVVVSERRFAMRRPARHVVGRQYAAMPLAARIHDVLSTAEAVDSFGDKSVAPRSARALDLGDAIASRAFGFFDDAAIGGRERRVGEQRTGRWHFVVRQVDRGRGRPMLAEQFRHRAYRCIGALQERMAVLRVADRGAKHLGK